MRKLVALLLMVCMLFSVAAAQEAAPEFCTVGRAVFRLPANAYDIPGEWALTVSETDGDGYLLAANQEIYLSAEIYFVDFNGMEDVDALSDADVFTDSALYMLRHCFGHNPTLAMETLTAMFTDAAQAGHALSLENGDKAKIAGGDADGMCFLTHYVDNTAFMIVVSSPIYPQAAVLAACEIANSLILGDAKPEAPEVPQQYAVVKNYNAKVRTEPNVKAKLIKTVFKGTTLPLLGESGDFYMVEINGQVGYIHKSTCNVQ